jgi:hypothetical protein
VIAEWCPIGWKRPHEFEPRYDKSAADISNFQKFSGYGVDQMLEKLRKVTYVRDVCTRCGKTIERSKP